MFETPLCLMCKHLTHELHISSTGPCQIRSCGNGLCVVVMGQRSECRCMPQQSPENCDYMGGYCMACFVFF